MHLLTMRYLGKLGGAMLDFNHGTTKKVTNLTNSININEQLNRLIDTALTTVHKEQPERHYLGASRLGVSCTRMLQYEFQKVPKDEGKEFTGQTLRNFAAGHVFEELAIKWLQGAGFTLLTEDEQGQQFGFKAAGGNIAGHVDGIITGVPDGFTLATPALWEMKSMNNKSWQETVKKGLVIAKPLYAAQIAMYQAYMEEKFAGISANPALFTAINKDTAELYHELIPFDAELAQRISDKAVNIILSQQLLINSSTITQLKY